MPSLRSLKIGKEGNINSSLPFSICSLLFSGLMKACHCQVPGHTWCHSGAARTEISVHSGPRGSTDLQILEHIGRRLPCLLRLFILSVDSMWNSNDYDIESLDWLLTDTWDNTYLISILCCRQCEKNSLFSNISYCSTQTIKSSSESNSPGQFYCKIGWESHQ